MNTRGLDGFFEKTGEPEPLPQPGKSKQAEERWHQPEPALRAVSGAPRNRAELLGFGHMECEESG